MSKAHSLYASNKVNFASNHANDTNNDDDDVEREGHSMAPA